MRGQSNDEGILLPFAMRSGSVVHISHVSPSARTGFTCPKCGDRLSARLGSRRRHHFAHRPGVDCTGAAETAIHICAKAIFTEHSEIMVPAVIIEWEERSRTVAKAQYVPYIEAQLESSLGSLRPDVRLLRPPKQDLLIEVRFSHETPQGKIDELRRRNAACLEIDVRRLVSEQSFDRDALRHLLIHDASSDLKTWLSIPDAERYAAELRAEAIAETRARAAAEAEAAARKLRIAEQLARSQAAKRRLPHARYRGEIPIVGPYGPSYSCFAYEPSEWQPFVFRQFIEYPNVKTVDAQAVADRLWDMHRGLLRSRSRESVLAAVVTYFDFLESIEVLTRTAGQKEHGGEIFGIAGR